MLENFKGKKVEILVAFGGSGNAVPKKFKGTITDFNDEAIV